MPEPEPTIIGLPQGGVHVIYLETDEESEPFGSMVLNSMAVEPKSVEHYEDPVQEGLIHRTAEAEFDPWLTVDYLIGEDCTPITIVAGNEIIAWRWVLHGRLIDEKGWRSGDPEKFPVPEEYKLPDEEELPF